MSTLANVGQTDKMIRLLVGIILVMVSFLTLGGFSSTMGIIAVVAGIVLIGTGLINFCPIYKLLGITTSKRKT